MQSDQVQQARLELEAGIVKHSRSLVDMKVRLNHLTPIARLPPELLSEIFWHYMISSCPLLPRHYDYMIDRHSWLSITHVCHHWREVAIACPRLWTQIYVTGPDSARLREMLKRSKNASLSVCTDGYNPREVGGLRRVLSQLERIELLDAALPLSICKKVFNPPPTSAPRLKKLRLTNLSAASSADDPLFFLKDCSLPSIHDVELDSYTVSWTHTMFNPTLTRLVIKSDTSHNILPPSVAETMQALANMPLLEHLDLTMTFLMAETRGAPPAPQSITLSRLNYLRLSSVYSIRGFPDTPYGELLDKLLYPNSAKTVLNFANSKIDNDFPSALTAPILRKLTGEGRIGDPLPIKGFAASGNFGMGCTFKFWSDVAPLVNPEDHSPPSFEVVLPSNAYLYRSTWVLCAALPLRDVEAFSLGCSPGTYAETTTTNTWVDALKQMSQMTWMHVIGQGGRYVADLLTEESDAQAQGAGDEEDAATYLAMGKLETLIMDEVRFLQDDDDDFLDILDDALQGLPNLKRFEIRRCVNVTQDDIRQLHDNGIPVVWDGVERMDESESEQEEYEDYYGEYGIEDDFPDWTEEDLDEMGAIFGFWG